MGTQTPPTAPRTLGRMITAKALSLSDNGGTQITAAREAGDLAERGQDSSNVSTHDISTLADLLANDEKV
jgi:hypothetical protein